MSNTYQAKRLNRIERLERRIERLRAFAKTNDLSLFSEEKSGIPLGQPILVGHHSERRHRRHLERINNLVRKGYDALKKADQLEERLRVVRLNNTIQVDNPDAAELLKNKIEKLTKNREYWKICNKLCRKFKTPETLAEAIKNAIPETKDPLKLATNLLTPDFAGRIGIPDYTLANTGAEIRRLEGRLKSLEQIQVGFESFKVGDVLVELVDGQIQVEFPSKPSERIRSMLKRSPVVLKWSNYSKRWVRKHTDTTCGRWFKDGLREVLEAHQDEVNNA